MGLGHQKVRDFEKNCEVYFIWVNSVKNFFQCINGYELFFHFLCASWWIALKAAFFMLLYMLHIKMIPKQSSIAVKSFSFFSPKIINISRSLCWVSFVFYSITWYNLLFSFTDTLFQTLLKEKTLTVTSNYSFQSFLESILWCFHQYHVRAQNNQ